MDALTPNHPGLRPEERKYRRFRVHTPAKFYVLQYLDLNLSALKDKAGDGSITNISHGGVELFSPLHLPQGMEISISFTLPACGEIQVLGRIAWIQTARQRFAYGITFTDYPREVQEKIGQYISNRSALERKIGSYLKTMYGPAPF